MVRVLVFCLLVTVSHCATLPPPESSVTTPAELPAEDIEVKPRLLSELTTNLFGLFGGERVNGFTTSVGPVIRSRVEQSCRELMRAMASPLPSPDAGPSVSSREKDVVVEPTTLSSTTTSSPPLPDPRNERPDVVNNNSIDESQDDEEIRVKPRALWSTMMGARDPYYGIMSLCMTVIANQGSPGVSVPALTG